MEAGDVVRIVDRLDAAGVASWLDGGWGVDALLGEQTRPHDDLDLILRLEDAGRTRQALADAGFAPVKDVPGSNFVLRDAGDREVDVHLVRLDDEGGGRYRMENGEEWVFPAGSFEGAGIVAGREVRCLTADVQMLCHAHGYTPSDTDFHDMRLLHERLGTRLLPPYDGPSPTTPPPTPADRARWVTEIRRRNEELQDAFAAAHDYDAEFGEIDEEHRDFVARILSLLPPRGRVLDAACGTGKYFPMVVWSGRSLLGVDQSTGMLAAAQASFQDIPTEKLDLHELPFEREFDGVMCVDAMESLTPEDWPAVIRRFGRALRPGGWLYLTIELAKPEVARAVNEDARAAGLPVVEGESFEPDGYYHYYPPLDRVRAWLADAGFGIEDEAEGVWHEGEWAYHHLLARLEAPPG